jgi:hypothetical protein
MKLCVNSAKGEKSSAGDDELGKLEVIGENVHLPRKENRSNNSWFICRAVISDTHGELCRVHALVGCQQQRRQADGSDSNENNVRDKLIIKKERNQIMVYPAW